MQISLMDGERVLTCNPYSFSDWERAFGEWCTDLLRPTICTNTSLYFAAGHLMTLMIDPGRPLLKFSQKLGNNGVIIYYWCFQVSNPFRLRISAFTGMTFSSGMYVVLDTWRGIIGVDESGKTKAIGSAVPTLAAAEEPAGRPLWENAPVVSVYPEQIAPGRPPRPSVIPDAYINPAARHG
jgi:hypothetical protein